MGDAGGVTLSETQVGDKARCPLLNNVDGKHSNLLDVLDAMQTDLETQIIFGPQFDLSDAGGSSTKGFFYADQSYTIAWAKLVYLEASSADAGVQISIGKITEGEADPDYFVDEVASEKSKEIGYAKTLTLLKTEVAEGDIITFTSAGGKTGTGEVVPVLKLIRG